MNGFVRRYRAGLLAISCLGLGSCEQLGLMSPPDVRVCEAYAKSQLKAPSTFKLKKTLSNDENDMTLAQFTAQTELNPPKNSPGRTLLEMEAKRGLGLRTVVLEYDADNAFGVPMAGTQVCAFKLIGGKLPDKLSLESSESRAETNDAIVAMKSAGYDTKKIDAITGPLPKFACCVQ